MVHTRTIREAAAYFRESGPRTCLTGVAIRTLPRTGAVPGARAGRKHLVTVEAPKAHLESFAAENPSEARPAGK